MRSGLALEPPVDALKGGKQALGFNCGPRAHAARSKLASAASDECSPCPILIGDDAQRQYLDSRNRGFADLTVSHRAGKLWNLSQPALIVFALGFD
jgi:hypothetical protein